MASKALRLSESEKALIRGMRRGTVVMLGHAAAAPVVETVEVKPHYFTKAELELGLGYPCQVDATCTKKTRSLERSLKHAANNVELVEFGHIAK